MKVRATQIALHAGANTSAVLGVSRRWAAWFCGMSLLASTVACGAAASATRSEPKHPTRSAASEPTRTARVMPLGDSITAGVNIKGGYRTDLWQLLSASGRRVDFVGSLSGGPARLPERRHEGHPGWEIRRLDAHVKSWLTAYRPNVVLLHIGTNDILRHDDLQDAPSRLSVLLGHITATLPATRVYVATVIPLGRLTLDARVRRYNSAVADLIHARAAQGEHVQLVSMYSALSRKDLSPDGIHPTAGGYSKMADRWYAAMTSSETRRWEAETIGRTLVNDGERLTDTNASGNGKVGYLNYPDSYVDFSVETARTGWYRVFVRAANGMKTRCSQRLVVNGHAQHEVDYPNDGWDHWTITSANVWLAAGRNTLRFAHQTCAAELDSIDVSYGGR